MYLRLAAGVLLLLAMGPPAGSSVFELPPVVARHETVGNAYGLWHVLIPEGGSAWFGTSQTSRGAKFGAQADWVEISPGAGLRHLAHSFWWEGVTSRAHVGRADLADAGLRVAFSGERASGGGWWGFHASEGERELRVLSIGWRDVPIRSTDHTLRGTPGVQALGFERGAAFGFAEEEFDGQAVLVAQPEPIVGLGAKAVWDARVAVPVSGRLHASFGGFASHPETLSMSYDDAQGNHPVAETCDNTCHARVDLTAAPAGTYTFRIERDVDTTTAPLFLLGADIP